MVPIKEALTFDDVTMAPKYSEVLPSEVNTSTKLSSNLTLKIPLLSSAMDTVTESKMAIAIAKAGGIGVIHRNLDIKKQIEEIIEHYNIDLVICDNITTSNELYQDVSVGTQSKTTTWFKKLTKITTVFVIAHTNTSDFNTRLLDENDVRGGKTISNISQFLYVLQPISVNESLFQFILIKKHRGQKVENKFFRLSYDKITMSFAKDYSVTFDELKDIFKLRNRL